MLYKVFIDDSGKKGFYDPYDPLKNYDPPEYKDDLSFWRNNYFVLCGVKIKQDDIGQINDEINNLKYTYFGTHDIEIKSNYLRHPEKRQKFYLTPYGLSEQKLNEFGEAFIDLIAAHKEDLKLFAAIHDKRQIRQRSEIKHDPLLKTTQILLERIHKSGGYNIVVFDQMDSGISLDSKNHKNILGVYTGNKGMSEIYISNYSNISDVSFMVSSKENFLQIADVCAYNVNRQFMEYGREWLDRSSIQDKKKLSTYPYFDRIAGNFYCSPYPNCQNRVRGYGITLYPDFAKINWSTKK